MQKIKLDLPVLLPANGDCEPCAERLLDTLRRRDGVYDAHLDRSNGRTAQLCLHYDPARVTAVAVEQHARDAGATVQQRYRHRELVIAGMDCADCALKLERGVGQLDGVLQATVNFTAGKMWVEYDTDAVDQGVIAGRVQRLGYRVQEPANAANAAAAVAPASTFVRFLTGHPRDVSTLLAGLLLLLAGVLTLGGAAGWLVNGIIVLATVTGGWFVARRGLNVLWINRELDMNFLMTVAAVGALVIGELWEAALVMFLFSLGETLEAYTMDRARQSIRSLLNLAPATATRLTGCLDCEEHLGQDGYSGGICPFCAQQETRVPVAELAVGDIILVKAGERIAMDGVVIAGSSAVNQASVTGESVPVDKALGGELFAGTLNGSGALEVRVTRLAADNTISRLIHLVEQAQAQKAPTQRWVDRFARIYTPTVVLGAILIALGPPLLAAQPFWNLPDGTHGWLYRALTMLVIACPCALVISTPVSIVSAISRAAKQGILIKGGASLETAGRLRVIAFDKTGTLTQGSPALTDVVLDPNAGITSDALLGLAAAVESRSEHPLAQAVVTAATERGLSVTPALNVQALSGRGARGLVNGESVLVGNVALFAEQGQALPSGLAQAVADLEAAGKTVMLVGRVPGPVLGLLAVADTVRPDAREALAGLKRAGITLTVMLTGDNERTARAIAEQAGVDEFRANLMPAQKVAALEALLAQHGSVAMVGDGVNDAPALARASVGVAMGGAGSDQALETADVVLLADDLRKLPALVTLSRRAWHIVRQNIAFSLGIKVVFMALALLGAATLWMAVFADMGASLIVIFNGMRLLRRATNEWDADVSSA